MQIFERQYGSDLEGSQIYAAYKYPRKDVKAVRPGAAVAAARPFSPAMLEVAYDGSTRRVGPFEMLPGTAAGAPGKAWPWPHMRTLQRCRDLFHAWIATFTLKTSSDVASPVQRHCICGRRRHFVEFPRTCI